MFSIKYCSRNLIYSRLFDTKLINYHYSTSYRWLCTLNSSIDDKITSYLQKFSKTYDQNECETFWSSIWNEKQLFTIKNNDPNKTDEFVLLLPPPNITGSLHLGHSLTVAIQDSLCRYNRMNGKHVRWYGGTDHAGIATQIIIEKILWKKFGKTRQHVSREEFRQIFDEWKQERCDEIEKQLRSLGVSIDMKQNYFTLSSEMSRNVNKAFIELFNRGYIYRASYMINWSYYLQSTLSDIEIEYQHINSPTDYTVPGCPEPFKLGVLHYFKYPLYESNNINDDDGHITIATTRLESLMGDVALAVHPSDERYAHLIGRYAWNPFTNEKMPIIGDDSVKPDFGTGVLKLTPGHSLIDYEIAQRHNLPAKIIFNDQGFIDCSYEPLNGVHRYVAKDLVRDELEKRNLYCGYKPHKHAIPVCSRSGDIIEQRIVPQWFLRAANSERHMAEFVVNRDNLSEKSEILWNDIRRNGILDEHNQNMSIIPSSYRNTWKDWFSRYKDWCISRQIYWGHRIPCYEIFDKSTAKTTDQWVAAMNEAEAIEIACRKFNLKTEEIDVRQDNDVLDTWFSSALLPLTVTGWFDDQQQQKSKHPLSLMETGHDIIFFWVARMTLLSLMLAKRLPFDRVLLHGMICDETGKKMSKSRGNVVDPEYLINGISLDDLLEQNRQYLDNGIISKDIFKKKMNYLLKVLPKGIPICGADILRLSLLQSNFKEQNINFNLQNTIKKRVFVNKIYQTIRFILINLPEDNNGDNDDDGQRPIDFDANSQFITANQDKLTDIDKWILIKLSQLINDCNQSFESYDLHVATRRLESFWLNNLCNIYLEYVKKSIINHENQSNDDDLFEYQKSMHLLIYIVRQSLRLLHPFMPFITENLYQHLEYRLNSGHYEYQSLIDAPYPKIAENSILKQFSNTIIEDNMEKCVEIVKKLRWFWQTFHVSRNNENIVHNIIIASLNNGNLATENYRSFIETSMRLPANSMRFIDLYDIYRYDDCYCFKVDLDDQHSSGQHHESSSSSSISDDDDDDESSNDDCNRTNSLKSNEIYLLISMNIDQFKEDLLKKFANNDPNKQMEKCENLLKELSGYHMKNFTRNYKKATKIIS